MPLFPLGKSELGFVLQHQLTSRINNEWRLGDNHELNGSQQGISLHVTAAAMGTFMEHIEFHTWLHKSTQQAIFTFSPTGAKPVTSSSTLVSNLSNRLLRDCLHRSSRGSTEMTDMLENNKFVLDTVLDDYSTFEDDSDSIEQVQYVLQSCPIALDDSITASQGSQCSEICRFQL